MMPTAESDRTRPEALDRRRFLARMGTAWLALHTLPAGAEASEGRGASGASARLLDLRLATAAPLDELAEFYRDRLGLELVERGDETLTVAAGVSRVTFVRSSETAVRPFYHFAFNIPENKVLDARRWQLEKTDLIAPWEHLRDPAFPDDVVWFRHWNAHSVFFFDPAGNVVEYIARHDLSNAASGGFSSRDILYVSEIGLIADDVPAVAAALGQSFGVGRYGRGSEAFTALGDEAGLLLVMRRGRQLAFAEGSPAGVFPTGVEIRAERTGTWSTPELPYRVEGRSPAGAR